MIQCFIATQWQVHIEMRLVVTFGMDRLVEVSNLLRFWGMNRCEKKSTKGRHFPSMCFSSNFRLKPSMV